MTTYRRIKYRGTVDWPNALKLASHGKAKQEQAPHHGIGGRDPSFLENKASLKGAANSKNTPTLLNRPPTANSWEALEEGS